jgi:hypothetical protein
MSWDEWDPLVRVGTPEFKVSAGGSVKVRLWIKGQLHDDWRGYFGSQVSSQRLDAAIDGFDSAWDSARRAGRYHVSGSCSPDDTEHYIEMLDTAIDYANTKFQADVLPHYVRGNRSMSRQRRLPGNNRPLLISWRRSWPSLSRRTGSSCPVWSTTVAPESSTSLTGESHSDATDADASVLDPTFTSCLASPIAKARRGLKALPTDSTA